MPPSPLSVHDRYSSPVAGSAKRRLFGDDHPSAGVTHGLTLISPAKRLMIGPSSTLKISAPGSPAALTLPLQGRGYCRHGSFSLDVPHIFKPCLSFNHFYNLTNSSSALRFFWDHQCSVSADHLAESHRVAGPSYL